MKKKTIGIALAALLVMTTTAFAAPSTSFIERIQQFFDNLTVNHTEAVLNKLDPEAEKVKKNAAAEIEKEIEKNQSEATAEIDQYIADKVKDYTANVEKEKKEYKEKIKQQKDEAVAKAKKKIDEHFAQHEADFENEILNNLD